MRYSVAAALLALCILGLAGCADRKQEPAPPTATVQENGVLPATAAQPSNLIEQNSRMAWWRDARFGMFIHWGLYAIPAGEWDGRTNHAEWIRHTAKIPIERYDQFVGQFNPAKFDADAWARMAAEAGMKYLVITSKHHDGFCLFDSKHTDFDIMATPFKRDVLKELAAACERHGVRLCFYHSIMDWHHPDYLPRRDWEAATRPVGNADFDRYTAYMKSQLRELLTNYGKIGVLWFDGEWESTWNHERGLDLFTTVRGLQPDIVINSRVDAGGGGLSALMRGKLLGDFGTPEQEIPATGVPGADWETCMTMNNNWGFNSHDHDWKSTSDLIRKLCDIASKGGNFLLNVGPTAEGEFPPEAVERLREIGRWMRANGEAIYGTKAGPFKSLPWGRCTARLDGRYRRLRATLYLHVFDWPSDGRLVLPGLDNDPGDATLLADPLHAKLPTRREGSDVIIEVPRTPPDQNCSVIVLQLPDAPAVREPPTITAARPIFIDTLDVEFGGGLPSAEIRYTIDGSAPTAASPYPHNRRVSLTDTATIRARIIRNGEPMTAETQATFTKVAPRVAQNPWELKPGLTYDCYEVEWSKLPDFGTLTPAKSGIVANFDLAPRTRLEHFAIRYRGLIRAARDGVYRFHVTSDDGSRLWIGEQLVVDHDGLHGMTAQFGDVALAVGVHPITVAYFNCTGGLGLEVSWEGPELSLQKVPDAALSHRQSSLTAADRASPRPSPQQLAWQELELAAFVHFGVNTFYDREWGDGREDPGIFNPLGFDARQWARSFKDAGMKQVILTCKHHDGFCMWPSKYTTHSVASSPWRGGKGDVVREVSDACREAGLKFGVYLSPWDRHEPSYGDSPRYNERFKNQLAEVLSNYGPVHEVWFDGACGEGPNGRKQEYDWDGFIETVRRLAPEAVIFSDAGPDVRWVGNENGFAGETNWSMLRRDEFYPGTPNYAPLTSGHEDGTHWLPAECNTSIRPGWFYHEKEDGQVKSLQQLLDIYYGSVGRNGVFLLNVPPTANGLIHENDAARLREWRAVLDETFATNLARGARVVTDASADQRSVGGATSRAASAVTTLVLPGEIEFDRVRLGEDIRNGQAVSAFEVQAWIEQDWRPITRGTTIGYRRLLRIPRVRTTSVRLVVLNARALPMIQDFGLFLASPREGGAVDR